MVWKLSFLNMSTLSLKSIFIIFSIFKFLDGSSVFAVRLIVFIDVIMDGTVHYHLSMSMFAIYRYR